MKDIMYTKQIRKKVKYSGIGYLSKKSCGGRGGDANYWAPNKIKIPRGFF